MQVGPPSREHHGVVADARRLLQQFAFAYLTCNGDAHAKNFSIHAPGGEWEVNPAYDLPSTHLYGDMTLALTLGGKSREDVGRADFVALGEASRVRGKATERILDDLLKNADAWIGRLDDLPFDARRSLGLQIQGKPIALAMVTGPQAAGAGRRKAGLVDARVLDRRTEHHERAALTGPDLMVLDPARPPNRSTRNSWSRCRPTYATACANAPFGDPRAPARLRCCHARTR